MEYKFAEILSMELFRWILVGALILRMVSVSVFNHLTWRKLASLTFTLAITGPFAVFGIFLLDTTITTVDWYGYPETLLILLLVSFAIGQLIAKLLVVLNESQNKAYLRSRDARLEQLKVRAAMLKPANSEHFLKGV